MSDVLLIVIDCYPLATAVLSEYGTRIVLIGDPFVKESKVTVESLVEKLRFDIIPVKTQLDIPLRSNRETHKQNQPLYRGLKKYRKP